jgi:hypothetical protein
MGEAAVKVLPERRWKQAPDVVQAELGPGQTAVLHLTTGRYHALNGVGSRIWALLAEPCTMASLCATLCNEYDVDTERCAREVERYLSMLSGLQLVEQAA